MLLGTSMLYLGHRSNTEQKIQQSKKTRSAHFSNLKLTTSNCAMIFSSCSLISDGNNWLVIPCFSMICWQIASHVLRSMCLSKSLWVRAGFKNNIDERASKCCTCSSIENVLPCCMFLFASCMKLLNWADMSTLLNIIRSFTVIYEALVSTD